MARFGSAAFSGGLVQSVGQIEQLMTAQARDDLQQLQPQGLGFGVGQRGGPTEGTSRYDDRPFGRALEGVG